VLLDQVPQRPGPGGGGAPAGGGGLDRPPPLGCLLPRRLQSGQGGGQVPGCPVSAKVVRRSALNWPRTISSETIERRNQGVGKRPAVLDAGLSQSILSGGFAVRRLTT
jgi:hypothetical protein